MTRIQNVAFCEKSRNKSARTHNKI